MRPILLLSLLCTACADPSAPAEPTSPEPPATASSVDLVDPRQPAGTAATPGWGYQRTVSADLNADGTPEAIWLLAQVEMRGNEPLWQDGQPWRVYIEAADGTQTPVYAQSVQGGTLEAFVTYAEAGQLPRVLLVERTPHVQRAFAVRYAGPEDVTTEQLMYAEIAEHLLPPPR